MIQTRALGQWGNQAFQYVVGKIVAERTNNAYLPPGQWFDKRGRPLQWHGPEFFRQDCTPGIGRQTHVANIAGMHWLDIDALPRDRDLNLTGYWQRYELLAPYKDRIRNDWLKIRTELPAINSEAIYIHVRRTDYVRNENGHSMNPRAQGIATSIDEYAACLDRFPRGRKIVLVTDDCRDPFLEEFKRFGLVECRSTTWDADFLTLAAARYLVLSQSTYSWWAGFLGRAERIVCPLFPGSLWWFGRELCGPPRAMGTDYPNLVVKDEGDRWQWISEQAA